MMPQHPDFDLHHRLKNAEDLFIEGIIVMSAALDRLTASVAALTAKVAAIPAPTPDDSTELNALADQVDAATTAIPAAS